MARRQASFTSPPDGLLPSCGHRLHLGCAPAVCSSPLARIRVDPLVSPVGVPHTLHCNARSYRRGGGGGRVGRKRHPVGLPRVHETAWPRTGAPGSPLATVHFRVVSSGAWAAVALTVPLPYGGVPPKKDPQPCMSKRLPRQEKITGRGGWCGGRGVGATSSEAHPYRTGLPAARA